MKLPIYDTHQRFYRQAHQYVADFQTKHHRAPTQEEFRAQAATLLETPPVP